MQSCLNAAVSEWGELLGKMNSLREPMTRFGEALWNCWQKGGKLLAAGNGGSATDAMHLVEELVVRYRKNRKALAAVALCDPSVLTCAGNDFGYDSVFERQVQALGRPGDVLAVFTTSGNSPNVLRALAAAKSAGLLTVGFLGKDGGKAKGLCDIQLIVPSDNTARIQEGHKLLYHTLCEWVDSKL